MDVIRVFEHEKGVRHETVHSVKSEIDEMYGWLQMMVGVIGIAVLFEYEIRMGHLSDKVSIDCALKFR